TGVTAIASATTTVPATATDSATSTTPATSTAIPTVSPAPPGGVCNAVDFPAPIRQRPTPGVGGDPGPFYGAPDDELVFPLGTYYYDHGSAAGTHFWNVCSPGDPVAILAFMRQSILSSSWTLLPNTGLHQDPLSLGAEKPVSPPTTPEYCRTLQIKVGLYPGYPGE